MRSAMTLERADLPRPETRAYLDLLHTHGCITTKSAEIYKGHGVTEQQYHVLRRGNFGRGNLDREPIDDIEKDV